jgi:hypothetical protein
MGAGNGSISRLQPLNGFRHIVAETSIPCVPFDVLLSIYNRAGQARVRDSESMVCTAL